MRKLCLVLLFVLSIAISVNAGTVGKIRGKVIDAATGEGISGATVMVEGTNLGASTAVDGSYFILQVPPGLHKVTCILVGYITSLQENIRVSVDTVTTIDFKMSPKLAGQDEVIVNAKKPIIKKDNTSGLKSYDSKEISKLVNPSMSGVLSEGETWRYNDNFNTEEYGLVKENTFMSALQNPLSTFSIDVDTASYANIRRYITSGQMPPKDAVRIEEMINYFTYDYPQPKGKDPFSITTETAVCPWNDKHKLVLIGLQGKVYEPSKLPPSNLVFLIDVSGSMSYENKLPLLKESFKLLVQNLRSEDTVSIVVYAGAPGLVLPPTKGKDKEAILAALDKLQSGGSTAGGAGIELAYKTAQEQFIKNGNNRIILATDGDFNVGTSDTGSLVRMIEEKRNAGIYLTILLFGVGNIKDDKMEQMADKGNGNYYYIDTIREAERVLVGQMSGTLFTIAKDVKIQVEFNPALVKGYRLIGYENRVMRNEDFSDDTKDAGELGAGHNVTALYEIIPADVKEKLPEYDDLKYQTMKINKEAFDSKELLTVKLRYKFPKDSQSNLLSVPLKDRTDSIENASNTLRFTAAVAGWGMLLRDSQFKGTITLDSVLDLAKKGIGKDPKGYKKEFLELVEKTKEMKK